MERITDSSQTSIHNQDSEEFYDKTEELRMKITSYFNQKQQDSDQDGEYQQFMGTNFTIQQMLRSNQATPPSQQDCSVQQRSLKYNETQMVNESLQTMNEEENQRYMPQDFSISDIAITQVNDQSFCSDNMSAIRASYSQCNGNNSLLTLENNQQSSSTLKDQIEHLYKWMAITKQKSISTFRTEQSSSNFGGVVPLSSHRMLSFRQKSLQGGYEQQQQQQLQQNWIGQSQNVIGIDNSSSSNSNNNYNSYQFNSQFWTSENRETESSFFLSKSLVQESQIEDFGTKYYDLALKRKGFFILKSYQIMRYKKAKLNAKLETYLQDKLMNKPFSKWYFQAQVHYIMRNALEKIERAMQTIKLREGFGQLKQACQHSSQRKSIRYSQPGRIMKQKVQKVSEERFRNGQLLHNSMVNQSLDTSNIIINRNNQSLLLDHDKENYNSLNIRKDEKKVYKKLERGGERKKDILRAKLDEIFPTNLKEEIEDEDCQNISNNYQNQREISAISFIEQTNKRAQDENVSFMSDKENVQDLLSTLQQQKKCNHLSNNFQQNQKKSLQQLLQRTINSYQHQEQQFYPERGGVTQQIIDQQQQTPDQSNVTIAYQSTQNCTTENNGNSIEENQDKQNKEKFTNKNVEHIFKRLQKKVLMQNHQQIAQQSNNSIMENNNKIMDETNLIDQRSTKNTSQQQYQYIQNQNSKPNDEDSMQKEQQYQFDNQNQITDPHQLTTTLDTEPSHDTSYSAIQSKRQKYDKNFAHNQHNISISSKNKSYNLGENKKVGNNQLQVQAQKKKQDQLQKLRTSLLQNSESDQEEDGYNEIEDVFVSTTKLEQESIDTKELASQQNHSKPHKKTMDFKQNNSYIPQQPNQKKLKQQKEMMKKPNSSISTNQKEINKHDNSKVSTQKEQSKKKYQGMISELENHLKFLNRKLVDQTLLNRMLNTIKQDLVSETILEEDSVN